MKITAAINSDRMIRKTSLLRLRNKTLNRFKKVAALTVEKKIVKKRKTMTVVSKNKEVAKTGQKRSPTKMGLRLALSLIGHRRIIIRNRRLMAASYSTSKPSMFSICA